MLRLVIDGIVFGLTLALVFGFGPAFFAMIQTSIDRGFRSAAMLALGVTACDTLIVSLCVMTSIQLVAQNETEMLLCSIGAGIILIIFGIFTYKKDGNPSEKQALEETKPGWTTFWKGFFMNVLNPFVLLFWLSAVAVAAGKFEGDKSMTVIFFAIVLGTNLFCDLLKAKGASFLKRFFNPHRLQILNRATGIGLGAFGIFIIIRGLVQFL